MKIAIHSIDGADTGRSVELPDDIFGIEPHEHSVYLAVKAYLANQRQGTHKAKERGEVKGSTRKIKRQKGTGTARAGDIKNPLFRGGGRVFGPRPRNYTQKLNKKVRRLARKSALSAKAAEGALIVVEDFAFDAPQTKAYINVLNKLNVGTEKTLLVTADYDATIHKSSRNLPKAAVARAQDVNTYQVLHANKLILAEGAIERLKETFA